MTNQNKNTAIYRLIDVASSAGFLLMKYHDGQKETYIIL